MIRMERWSRDSKNGPTPTLNQGINEKESNPTKMPELCNNT